MSADQFEKELVNNLTHDSCVLAVINKVFLTFKNEADTQQVKLLNIIVKRSDGYVSTYLNAKLNELYRDHFDLAVNTAMFLKYNKNQDYLYNFSIEQACMFHNQELIRKRIHGYNKRHYMDTNMELYLSKLEEAIKAGC